MGFFHLIRNLVVWVLLAGAVAFFGHRTYGVWFAGKALEGSEDTQETSPSVRRPPAPRARRSLAYRRVPPYSTYEVVAGRNLFSSDRREEVPEPEAPVAPAPVVPLRPLDSRFALFGVVIEGDQKKALVWNLNKAGPTDKDYVWVRVGDEVGNLKISEIGLDRLVVTLGDSTYTVRLTDENYQKQRRVVRDARARNRAKTIEIRKQAEQPTRSPAGGQPATAASKE